MEDRYSCDTVPVFLVRLTPHVSNMCKSLNLPGSGKDIAESKGVHRELEFEGPNQQESPV